ncbi:type II secretion system F family protein [Serinicoccus chungangensis]|uniref:type II secretion system F family protein n=1 Tax=Serinicoccus chungangensis TaxID=767452 RepID=UPI00111B5D59|nr:type II secretion system F family protein [Serinicoccus chungangensis]
MSVGDWTLVSLAAAAAAVPLLWWSGAAPGWTPRPTRRRVTGHGATPAGVPEALDLLALALQGGSSLGSAARHVAAVLPTPLREELDGVGRDLLLGLDTGPSWAAAGPRWRAARLSMEIAALAGVSPGPALRQAAADLRRQAVAGVEVATARLGVRLVIPLGLAFLPGFVLSTVVPLVLALVRDLSW